jgi:hypothetical protein
LLCIIRQETDLHNKSVFEMFSISSWTTSALLVVLVPLIIFKLLPYLQLWAYIARLPGPVAVPLIGSTYVYIGTSQVDLNSVFSYLADKYAVKKGFYCMWMGNPYVYLCTPERAKSLLKSPKHTTKSIIYDLYKPWLREGLLLSAGNKWNAQRKLLTSAFHFKILQQHH